MAEVYIGRQVRAGASGNDRLFEVDGFHRFVATDFQPVHVNKRSTAVDQVYPVAGVELGAQLYLLANDLLGVLQHTGEENQRGSPMSRNIWLVLKVMICLTECRSAFDGMVPQWVQLPPTVGLSSMMATRLLCLAAFIAAPSPEGPAPITTTS